MLLKKRLSLIIYFFLVCILHYKGFSGRKINLDFKHHSVNLLRQHLRVLAIN